jgi:hypothetical protein
MGYLAAEEVIVAAAVQTGRFFLPTAAAATAAR